MLRLFLLVITTALFLINTQQILGQEKIEVNIIRALIDNAEQQGYEVFIPQNDLKTVKNNWSKAIRNKTKEKVEENGDYITIKSTVIKEISSEPVGVYSRLMEKEGGVLLQAFFQQNGKYISETENPWVDEKIKRFLNDFARKLYIEAVEDELKDEEKALKSLNDDLNDLYKNEEDNIKRINSLERDIVNRKNNILLLENDLKRKIEEIEAQKDRLEEVQKTGDKELIKTEESKLKKLENEKKDIERSIEKEHKAIDDNEAEIRELQRENDALKIEQSRKLEEVKQQESKVLSVKTKLKNLK